MALDVIKTITEAEQAAKAAKEDTAALCKAKLREAREAGAELVAQARTRVSAEAETLRARADEEGKAAAIELAEKLKNQKAVIRASASGKMQEAASYIAGKIAEQ